jgi:hypothetical protein
MTTTHEGSGKSAGMAVGMGVVYRPHPEAPAEDGVIIELREGGAMVRYSALGSAKLTPYAMLTPLGPQS